MNYVIDFLKNPLFLAAALSWVAAQLCKLILQLVKRGDTSRLLTGGGMPSSHTATMMGLVIETALIYGTGGFEFPMAFFFMVMIVYDALNVRYQTGEQSKIINRMARDMAEDAENADKTSCIGNQTKTNASARAAYYRSVPKLKELLGHTLPEIIVGGIIGAAVAILIYNLI